MRVLGRLRCRKLRCSCWRKAWRAAWSSQTRKSAGLGRIGESKLGGRKSGGSQQRARGKLQLGEDIGVKY